MSLLDIFNAFESVNLTNEAGNLKHAQVRFFVTYDNSQSFGTAGADYAAGVMWKRWAQAYILAITRNKKICLRVRSGDVEGWAPWVVLNP